MSTACVRQLFLEPGAFNVRQKQIVKLCYKALVKHWSSLFDRGMKHETERQTKATKHTEKRGELGLLQGPGCRSRRWKGTLDGCHPEGLGPPSGLSWPHCHIMTAPRLAHSKRTKKFKNNKRAKTTDSYSSETRTRLHSRGPMLGWKTGQVFS